MFTGLVTQKNKILSLQDGMFVIERSDDTPIQIGQSIAHDGACMSVVSVDEESYTFFAMAESLSKTNFMTKSIGDEFNIEYSMQLGEALDGHFVTGHIDTSAKVSKIVRGDDDTLQITITYDLGYDRLVVPKGSIAINGVSLTVVETQVGGCNIWLIPVTLQETNLGSLQVDDSVNIEFDLLAKYAVGWGK